MDKNAHTNITSITDWKAEQRKKAVDLYEQGYKQTQIAEMLNVTQASVSIWIKKANRFGLDALQTRYSPGAPSKLTAEQKQQLQEMLRKDPRCFGFLGKNWVRKQVVELIKKTFNVTYHPSQMSRILKKLRWGAMESNLKAY